MELASRLADEPFSDHPECVCPVIGALLRTYNDIVGRRRRQDLIPCASAVLHTAGSQAVRDARMDHCVRAVDEFERSNGRRPHLRLGGASQQRVHLLRSQMSDRNGVNRFGAAVALYLRGHRDAGHERLLALVAELVNITDKPPLEVELMQLIESMERGEPVPA
jgi:hypothetical protein